MSKVNIKLKVNGDSMNLRQTPVSTKLKRWHFSEGLSDIFLTTHLSKDTIFYKVIFFHTVSAKLKRWHFSEGLSDMLLIIHLI